MKITTPRTCTLIALGCLSLASCMPAVKPVPVPPPAQPAPPPPPPTPPATVPEPDNWMDAPATPGDWSYRPMPGGSQAVFGSAAQQPDFILQCSRAQRVIALVRMGSAAEPVPLRVLTETQTTVLTAAPDRSPDRGAPAGLVASVNANDPLLDAMALSKGRFGVEVAGLPTLYLPSWPEVTRVIEDCR